MMTRDTWDCSNYALANRHITIKSERLRSTILLALMIFSTTVLCSQPSSYEIVSLCELDLNRTANKLDNLQLGTLSPATKGFIWDEEDNETWNYRPQGISKVDLSCREYVAVSWYGRSNQNYENRGAKISFVDIANMDSINYRHVLLVDSNYETFHDLHAGGIHHLDGFLYVLDSRDGAKKMYSFDLSNIQFVPDSDLSDFYDFRYILKSNETFELPIKPSCISYDWDTDEFLLGSFKMECEYGCVSNNESTFAWFNQANVDSNSPYHINFFDKIQGIASINDCSIPNQKQVWSSQSYGSGNPSKLYWTSYNRTPNNISSQFVDFASLCYSVIELPPGLEDLHIEEDKKTLWTHTEFGPNEGNGNNRLVFAFDIDDFPSTNSSSCTIWVDYDYKGSEYGSFCEPFDTLSEAVDAIEDNGVIYIKSSTGDEIITVDVQKTFIIKTWDGISIIGQ